MKRKLTAITLLICITVTIFPVNALAADVSTGDTMVTTNAVSNPFTDVSKSDWYYDAAMFVLQEGLFSGTSSNSFSPDASMTRAMFVTVIGRFAESLGENINSHHSNSFTDVAANEWYTNYVGWANANGIVTGYDTSTFGTDDNITREDMAVVLVRTFDYLNIEVTTGSTTTVSDYSSISGYARDSVSKILAMGVMNGYENGTFRPQNNATRAECAQLFRNYSSDIVVDVQEDLFLEFLDAIERGEYYGKLTPVGNSSWFWLSYIIVHPGGKMVGYMPENFEGTTYIMSATFKVSGGNRLTFPGQYYEIGTGEYSNYNPAYTYSLSGTTITFSEVGEFNLGECLEGLIALYSWELGYTTDPY